MYQFEILAILSLRWSGFKMSIYAPKMEVFGDYPCMGAISTKALPGKPSKGTPLHDFASFEYENPSRGLSCRGVSKKIYK